MHAFTPFNKVLLVEILPDRGLEIEESVRHANSMADRSTIQKHRPDENDEE